VPRSDEFNGSSNDGFPVMKSFFEKAGVGVDQVALADGRGVIP
jgi:hypothetical protein